MGGARIHYISAKPASQEPAVSLSCQRGRMRVLCSCAQLRYVRNKLACKRVRLATSEARAAHVQSLRKNFLQTLGLKVYQKALLPIPNYIRPNQEPGFLELALFPPATKAFIIARRSSDGNVASKRVLRSTDFAYIPPKIQLKFYHDKLRTGKRACTKCSRSPYNYVIVSARGPHPQMYGNYVKLRHSACIRNSMP